MATVIRPGEILKPPIDSIPMTAVLAQEEKRSNGAREAALAKLPDSWRTTMEQAEEWPFIDPDVALSSPVESFADFPTEEDDLPTRIVPFSEFEPWGKMDDETDRDYELFSHYRALGLTRTQAAVARFYKIGENYVQKVAKKRDWIERVKEWDDYRERIYTTKVLEDTRKMAHNHAEIASKGIQALSLSFDELLRRMEDQDGTWREEIDELSFRTLFSMVERSARVLPNLMGAERLSRGLPTQLHANVTIKENRVIVQTTDDLAAVVMGLQDILEKIQPEDDEEIEVEGEYIEDAVILD